MKTLRHKDAADAVDELSQHHQGSDVAATSPEWEALRALALHRDRRDAIETLVNGLDPSRCDRGPNTAMLAADIQDQGFVFPDPSRYKPYGPESKKGSHWWTYHLLRPDLATGLSPIGALPFSVEDGRGLLLATKARRFPRSLRVNLRRAVPTLNFPDQAVRPFAKGFPLTLPRDIARVPPADLVARLKPAKEGLGLAAARTYTALSDDILESVLGARQGIGALLSSDMPNAIVADKTNDLFDKFEFDHQLQRALFLRWLRSHLEDVSNSFAERTSALAGILHDDQGTRDAIANMAKALPSLEDRGDLLAKKQATADQFAETVEALRSDFEQITWLAKVAFPVLVEPKTPRQGKRRFARLSDPDREALLKLKLEIVEAASNDTGRD